MNDRTRRTACVAVVVVLSAISTGARAQAIADTPSDAPMERLTIATDLGFSYWTRSSLVDESRWALSNVLSVEWLPVPQVHLGLVVPLAYGRARDETSEYESSLAPGNPMITAAGELREGKLTIVVGGGITAPLADADSLVEAATLELAAAMRGLRDLWLWYSDGLALIGEARARWLDGPWDLRVEPSLGYIVDLTEPTTEVDLPGVSGGSTREPPDRLVLQVVTEGTYEVVETLWLGAGLAAVLFATGAPISPDGSSDAAQVSADVLVAWRHAGAFVEGRLTLNLDEPHGFAFAQSGVWGVRLAAGVPIL